MFLLVFMTTLVVGCVSFPPSAVPAIRTPTLLPDVTPTPLPVPTVITPTPLPDLTSTPLPENEGCATETFTENEEVLCWSFETYTYPKKQGWTRYVNAEYCFSFTYPSDWIITVSKNFVVVNPQAEPTIALVIGIRKDKEKVTIQRTGVGAGEIITVGTVLFLGQEISKDILRYENKDKRVLDKSVLYNYATEFLVGDLVFTISLDDFGTTDYDTFSLPEEIEALADEIVESFVLVK